MNVIVTGGTGFIGSHIVVELIKNNHTVWILDDLSNSEREVLDRIEQLIHTQVKFTCIDVTDYSQLFDTVNGQPIDGIIHLAGFKSVNESLTEPLKYYRNNLLSTINLLRLADELAIKRFVFSSSATVYGDGLSPFRETDDLLPTVNPYGETKAICERMIMDQSNVRQDKKFAILRYFNPVGAHPSGIIGENTHGNPTNLMPLILEVAMKKRPHLQVFGDDYDTSDGTGVRDYIHIVDLAKAHVATVERIQKPLSIYNIGTGVGYSVLELITVFERVNQVTVPYQIAARRAGDVGISYADATKINDELHWKAEKTLEDMVRDTWHYAEVQEGINK